MIVLSYAHPALLFYSMPFPAGLSTPFPPAPRRFPGNHSFDKKTWPSHFLGGARFFVCSAVFGKRFVRFSSLQLYIPFAVI